MAIAHVQSGGTNANNTTAVARAFGSNVATGSLIVVVAAKFSPSADAFVAGDCTQSAGTATLGTIAFDASVNVQVASGGTGNAAVGIWSAIVTGAGSLTMQVAGALAGSYLLLTTLEFSGSWDSSRLETSNSNSNSAIVAGAISVDSGNVTSAGAALMVAGMQSNVSTSCGTITDDAAWTSVYKNGTTTDDNGSTIYRIVGSGTTDKADWSYTPSSSGSTNGWSASVAVYKEVAGGGADTLMGQACL